MPTVNMSKGKGKGTFKMEFDTTSLDDGEDIVTTFESVSSYFVDGSVAVTGTLLQGASGVGTIRVGHTAGESVDVTYGVIGQ